jgi:hypothetical protein
LKAYISSLDHYGHRGLAEFHARQLERIKDAETRVSDIPSAWDAIKRDAERYRWLSDASGQEYESLLPSQMTGQLDAAIDNAIRRERIRNNPATPGENQAKSGEIADSAVQQK